MIDTTPAASITNGIEGLHSWLRPLQVFCSPSPQLRSWMRSSRVYREPFC
jgi:hypothetical protein